MKKGNTATIPQIMIQDDHVVSKPIKYLTLTRASETPTLHPSIVMHGIPCFTINKIIAEIDLI